MSAKQKTGKEKYAAETQKVLNEMGRKLDRSFKKEDARISGELIGIIKGMKGLAAKLDIHCSCATFQPKGRKEVMTSCRCADTVAKLKAKEKSFMNRKPFIVYNFAGALSGAHCRDSQGIFVPIPRCVRRGKTRKKAN